MSTINKEILLNREGTILLSHLLKTEISEFIYSVLKNLAIKNSIR